MTDRAGEEAPDGKDPGEASSGDPAAPPEARLSGPPAAPAGSRPRLGVVLGLVAAVAIAHGLATHTTFAGSERSLLILGAPYLAGSVLAFGAFMRDGSLRQRLLPRFGDLSLGVLLAALLLLASFGIRSVLVPAGSDRQEWLWRLYVQLGPTLSFERSLSTTLLLLGVAAAEELTWRGWVLRQLEERLGKRRGWLVAWLLYAAALAPTVVTLAGETAGPNPLLLLAGLGAGLVWTYLAARTGRLPPVVLSHLVFTWFSVVQFRVPGF